MCLHQIFLSFLLFVSLNLFAQSNSCDTSFLKVFGNPTTREQGTSIIDGADGSLYVGGLQEDKGLILKFTLDGDLVWSRTIDLSTDVEYITQILLDSDGRIAGCGQIGGSSSGGIPFAFLFDPQTQQLLWAKSYAPGETFVRCMIELGAGGNFLLSSDTQNPNNAELFEINRNTGDQVGANRKIFDLGTTESINEMAIVGNFIYGAGRYNTGNSFAQMRGTVTKLQLNDLSEVWTILTHVDPNQAARLYAQDMVVDSNAIVSVISGNDDGTTIDATEFFLQKTDFDGNVTMLKKYDVQGVSNEYIEEIVSVPDGYVLFGRTSILPPGDLLVVKVDKNFDVLWARFVYYDTNTNFTQFAVGQSKCMAIGTDVYFTAFTEGSLIGLPDLLLFKLNANGDVISNCVSNIFGAALVVMDVIDPFINQVSVIESVGALSTFNLSQAVSNGIDLQTTNLCVCVDCNMEETNLNVELCNGDFYPFAGQNLNQSGVYSDTLTTPLGCDSVVVLTLNFSSELSTELSASICDGESYVFNGNALSSAGLYLDTLSAFGGCDSIVSLNLLVWPNVQTTVSETICSTDSFLFNGDYLTQSGTYTAVFQTINGCDSTVTLELSLFPYYTSQIAAVTCEGTPFVFNGISYAQTGIYQLPYPDQNGCDSLVVLNLVVNPVIPPTIFTESLCEGESYDFYGQILTTSGSYTQSYTNLNGCDSTIVLQLTVYEHQDTSLSVLLCEGLSYDGYTEPGFYTDTLQTFAGCDSIRMLQLSFQLPTDSMDVDLCDGEAFLGFTESGVYTDTVYGMDGCDTLRTYFVTANNLYVPNVFSPDDNGINDHFEIFLSEPTSIQITYFAMFDRWGNMLYEVKDNNVVKWDGTFRGKPMNPAVLSYVLLYRCNGFEKNRHGSVTVVR